MSQARVWRVHRMCMEHGAHVHVHGVRVACALRSAHLGPGQGRQRADGRNAVPSVSLAACLCLSLLCVAHFLSLHSGAARGVAGEPPARPARQRQRRLLQRSRRGGAGMPAQCVLPRWRCWRCRAALHGAHCVRLHRLLVCVRADARPAVPRCWIGADPLLLCSSAPLFFCVASRALRASLVCGA
jgi:hypothetical protein